MSERAMISDRHEALDVREKQVVRSLIQINV